MDRPLYLQDLYMQKFDQSPIGRPNKRSMVNTEIDLTEEKEYKENESKMSREVTQESEEYEYEESKSPSTKEHNMQSSENTETKAFTLEDNIKEQMSQIQKEL
eukprot:521554-Ditylum_brightwellii.AAC.1